MLFYLFFSIIKIIPLALCLSTPEQQKCPAGYFLTSSSQCNPCPMNSVCDINGYSCSPGFGISSDGQSCMKCPYGKVKSGLGNFPCMNCPAGSEPAYNQEYCNVCATNTYKPSGDIMFCLPCPPNTKCKHESYVCAKGSYRSSETECSLCPSGTYKAEDADTPCSPCVNDTLSIANRTVCVSCSAGSFYSNEQEDCVRCPIGTESYQNNTQCITCKQGYYRPQLEDETCSPCPKSATCTSTSFKCNQGYYLAPSGKSCTTTPPSTPSKSNSIGDLSSASAIGMIATLVSITLIVTWYYRRWRDKHEDDQLPRDMRLVVSQLTPTVPLHRDDLVSPNSLASRRRFTFERVHSDDHLVVNKV